MTKPQKFTYISRTICPKTQVHYLDALDDEGRWWRAEMKQEEETWITYTKHWMMMT